MSSVKIVPIGFRMFNDIVVDIAVKQFGFIHVVIDDVKQKLMNSPLKPMDDISWVDLIGKLYSGNLVVTGRYKEDLDECVSMGWHILRSVPEGDTREGKDFIHFVEFPFIDANHRVKPCVLESIKGTIKGLLSHHPVMIPNLVLVGGDEPKIVYDWKRMRENKSSCDGSIPNLNVGQCQMIEM